MRAGLVTVTSDGSRDFVILPNGEKRILGTISVLNFIVETTLHIGRARQILDEYLKNGAVLLSIDLDKMEDLFERMSRKYASAFSLIEQIDRIPDLSSKGAHMSFEKRFAAVETALAKVESFQGQKITASSIELAHKAHAELRSLVACLGDENFVPVATPTQEAVVADAQVATPSVDTLQANTALTDDILNKVEATDAKIEQLVTAGRKFNASAARADLYAIAGKVAEVLNNVDMAQPWVGKELTQLANEADRIHGLFADAKV